MRTHEDYIADVAQIALGRLGEEDRAKARGIKLVYGAGPDGVRGVTYYNRWQGCDCDEHQPAPFVEISAFNQSSRAQITGTVIHELGHVLAGWEAGHGKGWKEACELLGLRRMKAAGTNYVWAMFAPDVRSAVLALDPVDEGQPVRALAGLIPGAGGAHFKGFKPCKAGIGTRGGTSRGKGSGSRMKLYECQCTPPVKVRHAGDRFHATCHTCGYAFERQ